MGSALAEALLREGWDVTVWNRSPGKAEPLIEKGAGAASTAEEALEASDVVLLCVTNHLVTMDILGRLKKAGYGPNRTLVQLTTMTPKESEGLAAWSEDRGLEYLEGSIVGVPENVKEQGANIVCSGPTSVFDRCKPLLQAFGPALHLSEEIGAAVSFDRVYYAFGYGALLSFIQAAALCQAKGFSQDVLTQIILSRWNRVGERYREMGEKIAKGDHSVSQARIAIWAGGFEQTLALCRELGVEDALPSAIMGNLQRAIDAGYADEELTAVAKVLLPNR
jgi:3-hydroxyisobutyrate dehydrogenase-like beta-hydroxyacid dehydrogenase